MKVKREIYGEPRMIHTFFPVSEDRELKEYITVSFGVMVAREEGDAEEKWCGMRWEATEDLDVLSSQHRAGEGHTPSSVLIQNREI